MNEYLDIMFHMKGRWNKELQCGEYVIQANHPVYSESFVIPQAFRSFNEWNNRAKERCITVSKLNVRHEE
jgi:hypothetical protein